MSTSSGTVEGGIEAVGEDGATPVHVEVEQLESTAPEHLRDLKYELAEEGYVVADVTAEACFDEDCSLATQSEVDRLREYVRAAAFLGASTLTVRVDEAAPGDEKLEPALAACEERARREGVVLELRR